MEKSKFSFKKLADPKAFKTTGVQIVGGLGGLITAAVANRSLNPTQGILAPAALFAAGMFGVHYYNADAPKNLLGKLLQSAAVGTAIFGGLKTTEYGLTKLGMSGLNGFLPPEVITKIKSLIPTINGMGDASAPSGYYSDPMASMMGLNAYYDTYSSNQKQYYATPINGVVEGDFQVAEVL